MAQMPTLLVSHTRRVCSLYKKMRRNIEDSLTLTFLKTQFSLRERYQMVKLRAEFDKNKNIKDMRKAYKLLVETEQWFEEHKHPYPFKFPNSPGGIAYDRVIQYPDWMLDFWDPMEKAFYPKHFAEREKMKKEYEEFYYKQYPEMREDKGDSKK